MLTTMFGVLLSMKCFTTALWLQPSLVTSFAPHDMVARVTFSATGPLLSEIESNNFANSNNESSCWHWLQPIDRSPTQLQSHTQTFTAWEHTHTHTHTHTHNYCTCNPNAFRGLIRDLRMTLVYLQHACAPILRSSKWPVFLVLWAALSAKKTCQILHHARISHYRVTIDKHESN